MTDLAELAVTEAVLQKLTFELTRMSQTSERLSTGSMNNILEVGSIIIGDVGFATKSYQATIGGLEVRNHGDFTAIVQGGPGGTRPIQGAGTSYVDPASWRTVNVLSRSFTVYGTPGQLIGYQAFTIGLQPAAGTLGTAALLSVPLAAGLVAPTNTGTAGQQIRRFNGYSVRETAGAAAVVRIWNNTAASGTLLATIALAANGSASSSAAGRGVAATNGIFVEIVSGTVEGTVFYS
jgi:hypothetical protein